MLFGFILIKAEVVSWFRIQEMFRFQSFHMYGVICSAIVVGLISLQIIKRFKIKTFSGEEIKVAKKDFTKGNIIGGFMFGLGWAMTGACPGPLYALIGSGLPMLDARIPQPDAQTRGGPESARTPFQPRLRQRHVQGQGDMRSVQLHVNQFSVGAPAPVIGGVEAQGALPGGIQGPVQVAGR